MPERNGDLGDHELGLFFVESSHFDKMPEKFTTLNKLHDKENSIFVLENVIHADDERMINIEEDLLLQVKRLK